MASWTTVGECSGNLFSKAEAQTLSRSPFQKYLAKVPRLQEKPEAELDKGLGNADQWPTVLSLFVNLGVS